MLTVARIMAIVPITDTARAKAFHGETLGLIDVNPSTPGPPSDLSMWGGTLLEVYERPTAGEAQHTLASWAVSDVRAAVDQLRNRRVRFEEYDLPEVKTEDGISTSGGYQEAWFRDPDGNILRIHSQTETYSPDDACAAASRSRNQDAEIPEIHGSSRCGTRPRSTQPLS